MNIQAASGLYSMGQNQGGNVHAFLLDDGKELTLIDTLFDSDAHRIIAQIEAIGRKVQDLKHIILTHGHRSHLGGLAKLKELSGAQVYSHEWEADIISGDRQSQPVSLWPHPPYQAYYLQIGQYFDLSKHVPVTVDHYIHEGDQVGPVKIIFAAGHSPGHLAFYWPERRALIAGDAVCTWPYLILGWKGFLLNPKQHEQSLKRLAEYDSEVICVGHGEPITENAASVLRNALSQQKRP
jgi:glyoxylase-like metal-dependent hydrolase (beta-lactamase superfamily II)